MTSAATAASAAMAARQHAATKDVDDVDDMANAEVRMATPDVIDVFVAHMFFVAISHLLA